MSLDLCALDRWITRERPEAGDGDEVDPGPQPEALEDQPDPAPHRSACGCFDCRVAR